MLCLNSVGYGPVNFCWMSLSIGKDDSHGKLYKVKYKILKDTGKGNTIK